MRPFNLGDPVATLVKKPSAFMKALKKKVLDFLVQMFESYLL